MPYFFSHTDLERAFTWLDGQHKWTDGPADRCWQRSYPHYVLRQQRVRRLFACRHYRQRDLTAHVELHRLQVSIAYCFEAGRGFSAKLTGRVSPIRLNP